MKKKLFACALVIDILVRKMTNVYFDKLIRIFYPLSITIKLNELNRIEIVHKSRKLVSYSVKIHLKP